jgi:hypothetical protein
MMISSRMSSSARTSRSSSGVSSCSSSLSGGQYENPDSPDSLVYSESRFATSNNNNNHQQQQQPPLIMPILTPLMMMSPPPPIMTSSNIPPPIPVELTSVSGQYSAVVSGKGGKRQQRAPISRSPSLQVHPTSC